MHSRTAIFRLRRPSLVRGIALSLIAFATSLRLGGFPNINALHASHWQIGAALVAFWACLRRRAASAGAGRSITRGFCCCCTQT